MMFEEKNKPPPFKTIHRKWGGRKVKSIGPLLCCRVLAGQLLLTHYSRGDGVSACWLHSPCMPQVGEMKLVLRSARHQSLLLLCFGKDRQEFSTSCQECIFLCKRLLRCSLLQMLQESLKCGPRGLPLDFSMPQGWFWLTKHELFHILSSADNRPQAPPVPLSLDWPKAHLYF